MDSFGVLQGETQYGLQDERDRERQILWPGLTLGIY